MQFFGNLKIVIPGNKKQKAIFYQEKVLIYEHTFEDLY